jgi:acylphosphatase
MKIRLTVIVRGRVQGVAFRHHTARTAQEHRVAGWVRNLYDGSVEACFEGEEMDVLAMAKWCQRGPELARVDELIEKLEEYTGEFAGFKIRDSYE